MCCTLPYNFQPLDIMLRTCTGVHLPACPCPHSGQSQSIIPVLSPFLSIELRSHLEAGGDRLVGLVAALVGAGVEEHAVGGTVSLQHLPYALPRLGGLAYASLRLHTGAEVRTQELKAAVLGLSLQLAWSMADCC